jgi:heterodisulfide reductase subunit A-like polyferredoxin
MNKKPKFIMCNCTGECPGFKDMNFWKLMNFVRNELDVQYAVLHPQLCVDDGERFMEDIVKEDGLLIIGACDPRMQEKMLRDAFQKKGLEFKKHVIALDLRNMKTEEAMEKVRQAVESLRKEV